MFRNYPQRKAISFAICSALATALVAGCAGSGHLARAGAHAEKLRGEDASKLDRAVAKAEEGVLRSPADAAARAVLGGAYLDAGRFESAATTFQDAIALGDSSGSTALRLALAQIGTGRSRKAVAVLEQNSQAIPAGDLGLALALAGDTARSIDVLANALRGGEASPKLRQNLAYAYALGGRWLEARLMAAQDVPLDQLDARMSSWALMARPEESNRRVASLLGAPIRPDEGQPVELALADRTPAPEPTPIVAVVDASGELPPVDKNASDPSPEFAAAEIEAPVATPLLPVTPTGFNPPFAKVSQPVVRPVRAPAYLLKPKARVPAKPVAPVGSLAKATGASHKVQLGSFSSPENARRAIKLLRTRNPELKTYELAITPAIVRGRNFWRVSAAGFSQASAFDVCSKVKTRGGGCIAYSASRTLPGVLPARGKSGIAMARR